MSDLPPLPGTSPESDAALAVVRRLHEAGHTAYWAGGCVRDILMGQTPKDYDVATSARPDEVAGLFPGAMGVGKAFGVMRVPHGKIFVEVATFRRESAYADGRHPDAVEFADARSDACRRDFTINAIFYDPLENKVLDYVGGMADIRARLVRCVGQPSDRFREDHLRMLRAIRFTFALGFRMDSSVASAIREMASHASRISPERVRDELTRILTGSLAPGQALAHMHDTGLIAVLFPEIERLAGQPQPPEHHPEGNVFLHTVKMLDLMKVPHEFTPTQAVVLAYAVLLHDVGKPAAAQYDGKGLRFNGHAALGAEMAAAILQRLRFPTRDIEDITYCVRNHMRFMDVQKMRLATLRHLVGAPTFPVELELHRIDCLASHGHLDNHNFLVAFLAQSEKEPLLPHPWVTGEDLMALGLPKGPQVGKWKHAAYEAQLDGTFGTREELLEWVRQGIARKDD